jgi:hypothetical protein
MWHRTAGRLFTKQWEEYGTRLPYVTILKNNKAEFKAALRKYLHTHLFYSVDKFFMCKDDL